MLHKSPLLSPKGVQAYITKLLPNTGLQKKAVLEGLEQRLAFNLEWAIKKGAIFTAPL
jgi:hypothetical protein